MTSTVDAGTMSGPQILSRAIGMKLYAALQFFSAVPRGTSKFADVVPVGYTVLFQ